MAPAEPHPGTSICQSTCTSKPSACKRANSESISQPLPSSQRAKKTCTATSLPANPRRQQIVIIDDIDKEEQAGEGEDEDKDTASSTIDDDPIEASQSREQAEEVDEDNFAEENIMKYSSREVIEKAVLWQLEVVRLEAVASYERCRALDECPLELQSQQNFLDALEILKMWHEQHKRVSLRVTLYLKEAITKPQSQASSSSRTTSSRRTATQRQLAELPFILQ
ncbi:MAG: hypothetical protein M1813_002372, partial [Trichoglossum hirsutum]